MLAGLTYLLIELMADAAPLVDCSANRADCEAGDLILYRVVRSLPLSAWLQIQQGRRKLR